MSAPFTRRTALQICLSASCAAALSTVDAATAADQESGTQPLPVLLLAGQSNMAGADSEVAEPPGFVQTEADQATRFTTAPLPDGARAPGYVPWQSLRGHRLKDKLVHGPEVGLARTLYDAGWRELAIIKVFANFRRDVVEWPWGEGQPLGRAWHAFVDERLSELRQSGRRFAVRGFVWHQGIDDAIQGPLADRYEANLTALIAALRRRYDAPQAPFVLARSVHSRIAQPQPDPTGDSPMDKVRRAQMAVGDKVARAAWINVDDQPNVNTHHFTAAGQRVLGQRFAQALLRWSP